MFKKSWTPSPESSMTPRLSMVAGRYALAYPAFPGLHRVLCTKYVFVKENYMEAGVQQKPNGLVIASIRATQVERPRQEGVERAHADTRGRL